MLYKRRKSYAPKRKVYKKKPATASKRKYKKSTQSLASKVNILMKNVKPLYDTRIWDNGFLSTTLSSTTVYNLTDFQLYVRLFSGINDAITNLKMEIKSFQIQCFFRPILDQALAANNTPLNECIYFRAFLVSPKWAYRVIENSAGQSVTPGTSTLVTTAGLIQGAHWDASGDMTSANLNFAPILNSKCFTVHAFRDYKYYPTQFITGLSTNSTTDPVHASRSFKFNYYPKGQRINRFNGNWDGMSPDDIPLSKQLYIIMIAHTNIAGTTIPFKTQINVRMNVKELSNK